ncbi:MAG: hypothetical protein AAF583_16975 [Pseudomonadota bacterium]
MGSGNKVEMLIAVCALISSAAAVFIAWDQGRVMRAQQHGEVFPILQIDGFNFNTPTYSTLGFLVRNSGVGPAIIESVELEIDGQIVDSTNNPLNTLPPNYDITTVPLTGRALAPGEEVTPVDLRWARDDVPLEQIFQFARATQEWKMKICYCSVFTRCWQTTGFGSARAEPVSSCRRSNTDLFAEFIPQSRIPDVVTSGTTEQPSADGANQ